MVNTDKVKAARQSDKGKKHMAKVQAISNAQKKAHQDEGRMRGIHNAAANREDSTRMTEHELEMLEQKKKREIKEAKALEFQRRVEEAAACDQVPELQAAAPAAAVTIGGQERHRQGTIVSRASSKADALSEEQRKAQVAAMVQARQRDFQRARHAAASAPPPPPRHDDVGAGASSESSEERLDRMLDDLMGSGALTEAQADHITDRLAAGAATPQECLEELSSQLWGLRSTAQGEPSIPLD